MSEKKHEEILRKVKFQRDLDSLVRKSEGCERVVLLTLQGAMIRRERGNPEALYELRDRCSEFCHELLAVIEAEELVKKK